MAQIVKLKRSTSGGSKPTTSSLTVGELAINVNDGRVFLRKSGSAVGDTIKEFVTLDHEGTLTGSLNISGSVTASNFVGDGSKLTNISVSQTATVKAEFTNSDTWSVDHNLDTENPIIQAYDSNNFQVIPLSIQLINNNQARLIFTGNESGYVVVAKGGHLVSGSISAESISGFDAKVKTKLNADGVFSSSAQISMGGDVSGTANAVVITNIDGGSV
tara:strand:- start:3805 stop:4455 length:651 start_codon:yes stop_codon:yes gene_type:complete